jgi:tetratricopeptide (TPR) repeat protein
MKNTTLILVLLVFISSSSFAATSDIEAALMNKNYEQVRVLAQKVLKESTDAQSRLQAEYYLGLSQLRLGRYTDARSAFQIVMSTAPSQERYDRAALGMIEALYIPGLYKEALRSTEDLLRKSPQSSFLSLIYLKKARIHLKLTQWIEAKENLQKILNEFPDSLEASAARRFLEEKEYFSVQVGSFLDKDKAIHLMDELKANGQYAYIIETTTPDNKKFYRVRVGQMASMSDAQTLEVKLSQLGYPTLIYP